MILFSHSLISVGSCVPETEPEQRHGSRPHSTLLLDSRTQAHTWHSGAPRDLTFDPSPTLVIGCVFNPLPPFSINGAQGLVALDPLLTPAARTLSHLSHGLGEVTPYNLHSDSETSVESETSVSPPPFSMIFRVQRR